MSVLQRLWNNTETTNRSTKQKDEVESLSEQVFNPYTELQVLQGHGDIVRLLLKIDNTRFASAADDNTAVIWNIKTAQKSCVLYGHTRPVACMLLLAPSSEGFEDPMLVTGSSDKQIKVWDIETGECVQTVLDHSSSVRSLLSLENGSLFCSGGKKLCVWTRKGQLLSSTLSLNDEDINLMIATKNNRVVTAADKQLCVYSVVKIITSLTSNTDCSYEVTLVKKLPPHREAIRCLINVSDASFASGSIDGTIILWTTQTLAPSRYFNSIPDYQGREHLYPYSIQHMICIDERYIVAGIGSGFCVYDTVCGSVLMTKAKAHYSKILFVGFVWDNTFLVTCSEDGSLRLWGHSQTLQLAQLDTSKHGDNVLSRFTGYSLWGHSQTLQLAQLDTSKHRDNVLSRFTGYRYYSWLSLTPVNTGTMSSHDLLATGKGSEDGCLSLWGHSQTLQLAQLDTSKHGDNGSGDGCLSLWGHSQTLQLAPLDTNKHGDNVLSRFTGYSIDYLRHCRAEDYLMELQLMGECLGHSGAVQMFLDYGTHGVVSCGVDSLIIAWKNAEIQSLNRTDLLREMLMGAAGIV
ncbi:WD repeat-containing protein 41-like [Liolophura sinensis]|uniref:WD repeat-containing protein 41-like n=1 Tax=Liolophura sinensis TaxID=3198878 RepID=UPI003158D4EE